jgi:hypothetical protein
MTDTSVFGQVQRCVRAVTDANHQDTASKFVDPGQGRILSKPIAQGMVARDEAGILTPRRKGNLRMLASPDSRLFTKTLRDCAHASCWRQIGLEGWHWAPDCLPPGLIDGRVLPFSRVAQVTGDKLMASISAIFSSL